MEQTLRFVARQALLISLAALAYFGVRGLTERDPQTAHRNAERVLELERRLGLDIELGVQDLLHQRELLVDLANWVYIWGHWPVVIVTLVVLAVARRPDFFHLRNAMFISGAIGLVIFALYAVEPPRLFADAYVDTVTARSNAYRVLQPPSLVNKYAAIPSLHFGWNLLVGISWARTTQSRLASIAAVAMPSAMAAAVVATANHWTLDVVVGGLVAMGGFAIERWRTRFVDGRRSVLGANSPDPDRDLRPNGSSASDEGQEVEARQDADGLVGPTLGHEQVVDVLGAHQPRRLGCRGVDVDGQGRPGDDVAE